MISFEEARAAVFAAALPLGTEEVRLEEAFRRVLASDIASPRALPPFDNSAMDGYAVRSRDTALGRPVVLRLVGEVPAGSAPAGPLGPGTAMKIMTGAPVPPGADAVVPRESVEERPAEIVVSHPIGPGANVRPKGEDIDVGEPALHRGALLNSASIGFLAALGFAKVPVFLRPSVGIITTGSEIRDVSEELVPGAIYDSNRHALRAQVASAGALVAFEGRVPDDSGKTITTLREAARKSRVVLTAGGVSMGDYDLVRGAFEAVGARRVFWKVAQKPGMPLAFYVLDGADGPRWFFGLPGNPGAVMITFEEYVRPFLRLLVGRADFLGREFDARLVGGFRKKEGRLQFIRVKLVMRSGEWWAEETGHQGSGILRSLVPAEGVARIPAEAESLPAGIKVRVHGIEW